MAATSTHAEPAARVPAWKRLGLKLKYAKDTPNEAQPEVTTTVVTRLAPPQAAIEASPKPPKRALEFNQPEAPTKRSRVESAKPAIREKPYPGSAPKTKTAGQQVWNDEDRSSLPGPSGVFKAPGQSAKRIVFDDEDFKEAPQKEATPPKQARPLPLRKSVSFTPDTKQEDSFPAQNIFKAWAAGEDPSEVTTKESTEQSPSPSKAPKEPKPAKVKKDKTKKKGKKTAESDESKIEEADDPTSCELPNYIKYLERFTDDKGSWKFNKNRQNDLFKHLFDTERLPPRYNDALVQYISTTQGQARRRIAEQAEEVLKTILVSENEDVDPMSIETPEGRRLAYFEALAASVKRYEESGAGRTQFGDEKLKEVLREHEKGRRAELVLQRALEGQFFAEQPKPPAPTSNSTNGNTASTTSIAIPRATRVIETQKTARGQVSTTEIKIKPEPAKKRARKSKSRSAVSDSSDSSDSADSDSDSSDDSSDGGVPVTKKPTLQKMKSAPGRSTMPPLFDADVLDRKFGKRTT